MGNQLRTPTNPATLIRTGVLDEPRDKKAEYQRFCADLRKHVPPLEAEYAGFPTYAEWLEAQGDA